MRSEHRLRTIVKAVTSVQVVLAPHIYCPEVSGATECFSGQPLYDALDKSFGYLTVSPGFCSGSNCHVRPQLSHQKYSSWLRTSRVLLVSGHLYKGA